VGEFDTFFDARVSEMVPFSRAVFRLAAEVRARFNFKAPDALHLAAAVEGKCDAFLTNDAQLTRFTGIRVDVV
jgi:predicted nucleic acid-binding protein